MAGCGLGTDGGSVGVLLLNEVENPKVHVGNDVDLGESERDRAAGQPADVAVHSDLLTGEPALRVVSATQLGRRLEHRSLVVGQHPGEGEQFVGGGVGTGHIAAVGHPVQESP